MGLITAIVGGMVVSMISGSKLTIKGPAAGLIVIVAGSVTDFGGGETGWHLALGAMFVAAVIQILFGVFKFGKLADFFHYLLYMVCWLLLESSSLQNNCRSC